MAQAYVSPLCLSRLKKDIKDILDDRPPGIFISVDEHDITRIHALIIGPKDTPYHSGFFYLRLKFPPQYPIKPPQVKLMTTGQGKVRFNPNLYECGKVCLSILGTWDGPSWSAAQSVATVLLSIQSLLNEKPYFNEPGFDQEQNEGDSDRYNEIIEHETLRVAVCDMLEGKTLDSRLFPQPLREIMERQFLEFYDHYERKARSKLHLTKKPMVGPFFRNTRRFFDYTSILKRLSNIRSLLEAKLSTAGDSASQIKTLS